MGIYGFILVFVGGGLGSALRHGSNLLALRLVGSAYPLGTLAINVLGAFVMGVVVEWFALKTSLPQSARLFITTGTFTTGAIKEATRDGAPPIDLVDGDELAEKLKELSLGVTTELVPRVVVHPDWFVGISNGK